MRDRPRVDLGAEARPQSRDAERLKRVHASDGELAGSDSYDELLDVRALDDV